MVRLPSSDFCALPSYFCRFYLSPLFPIACALFFATEPLQPLSHQFLARSFPFNWGGACHSSRNSPPSKHSTLRLTSRSLIPALRSLRKPFEISSILVLLTPALLSLFLTVTSSPAVASQSSGQTEILLSSAKDLFQNGKFTEADHAVRQYL